jgi:serine protease
LKKKELNVLSEEEFVTDEILVKFKRGVGKDKIDRINSKHGAFVRHTSPYTQSKRMGIPKGKTVAEMVKLYQAEDAVEYVEPNYIAHALVVPNDPLYSYQWHLDTVQYGGIEMEEAWEISTGSGVTVAVVDTGVAYENYGWRYKQAPDLAGTSFVQGYDFVNDDAHPNDDNSHGTHVTGTIAQTTDNNIGVAGVAFDCLIMPVKVLNRQGSGTYDQVAGGIYYAADNGAHVISLSLGGSADSETLKNAVKYAYENGELAQ